MDEARAAMWFCYAAKNGNAGAQMQVARLYDGSLQFASYPIETDLAKAYLWYRFAARRLHDGAKEAAERVKTRLSEADVGRAERHLSDARAAPCGAV